MSRSIPLAVCWLTYAKQREASAIVRGLRAISDFEYELQMALMNRRLNSEIETVFMMPAEPYTYVSSAAGERGLRAGRFDRRPRPGCRRDPVASEARTLSEIPFSSPRMTDTLSQRTRRVTASPTQKVTQEAAELRQQGIDVVDLGAGEPDFSTPSHINAAGIAAITEGFTKYTANAGIPELREAICARYAETYGITFAPASTIVTAGGKQALFNVAMALLDPGDEVITHAPGWPTIVDQVKLAGASPVIARTHPEDGFAVHAEAILEAVTAQTKAIVINSPGNPTGGLISESGTGDDRKGGGQARDLGRARSLLRAVDLLRHPPTICHAC